jgi:Rod binding domain-containing protein
MTFKVGPTIQPIAAKHLESLSKGPKHATAEEAAGQFENLMALQMIRSMQSSLDDGNMFGGGVAGDVYSGLAEWQLAQILTKGSHFGLKEQILRQLPKAEDNQS